MNAFARATRSLRDYDPVRVTGRVRRVVGLVAEAEGLPLAVGSSCRLVCRGQGSRELDAEVVGFRDGRTLLLPYGRLDGVAPGDRVVHDGAKLDVGVGRELLGRVVDGRGLPIDGAGPLGAMERFSLDQPPVPAMRRQRIAAPVGTGVRAIDTLLACGKGQRMGIFAGSGVGKSTILGMLARRCEVPITVVALIGERGREVREFIERDLGPEGLARSVVVVATSDDPPVLRLRAARTATAIAEWFRDQGEDVLLLLDSLTRVALAQREVGLSANEPPTTRGFTPSVFTLLPQLLERTGAGERGTITSFYTVLVEGDDLHDPIGDAVRGILDGHIWLSRKLAARGHFPAIDVLESVSRVMPEVVEEEHVAAAQQVGEDLARARDVEDLVQLGAYVRGQDTRTDGALDRLPAIEELLRQGAKDSCTRTEAVESMLAIGRERGLRAMARGGFGGSPGPVPIGGGAESGDARGTEGGTR
ncbi:MAG: FliI/YscN family ATPase [Planctomycetota bacterium]